jgi:hypothetical protein
MRSGLPMLLPMAPRELRAAAVRRLAWSLVVFAASFTALGSVSHAQRARNGALVLEGDHAGSEVWIDGESVGVLPLDPVELSPGEHTVRVTMPGFSEFNQVVRIDRRRETRVLVELYPVSMSLLVVTEPEGARVFVDGNFAGAGPAQLELTEGRHSIRVTMLGFREHLEELDAALGSSQTLEVTLEALPEEERRALLEPPVPEWYEEPLVWILAGGGALLVAGGIVLIVVLTAESDLQWEQHCAGDCLRGHFDF